VIRKPVINCEIPFGGISDAKTYTFFTLKFHPNNDNSVIAHSTKAPQFCSFKLGSAAGKTWFYRPKSGN